MAYTAPVFDASGQTFAQLKTRGFAGHVTSYVAALTSETPSFNAKELTARLVQAQYQAGLVIEKCRNVVDGYTNGTVPKADAKTAIYDLQLAFGSIATSLGEIGVLIDAN